MCTLLSFTTKHKNADLGMMFGFLAEWGSQSITNLSEMLVMNPLIYLIKNKASKPDFEFKVF